MTHSEGDGQVPQPRAPRLPGPGWLPDPSRMDLERFWNGTSWTARTRDIVSKLERVPLGYPGETEGRNSRGRLSQGRRSRQKQGGGFAGFLTFVLVALLVVGGAGYLGALPSWVPWPAEFVRSMPTGPAVAYPVFGSNDTVTYLARNLVAQEPEIDVTWIQASGRDVRTVVQDAMDEAMLQNPYAFVNGWNMSIGTARVRVEPKYTYSAAEAERRRVATASAVAAIVATPAVAQASDTRAKVKAIHDAVLRAATYDKAAGAAIAAGVTSAASPEVAQSQQAYGILVAGTAVCTGYAMAFQALAQASGLQSVVVTGVATSGVTTGGHAWNRVLVGGQWLVVDTTWDDATDARLGTDYLMISSQDPLMKTRTVDMDWVVDADVGMYGG
ncbi:transglutaminase domain-containing protein [Demequina lutea]|uniref:Transglutaminase-like domain-containing protein n=1 Tax=Demequina lutea TaxID=431489 RepID=A0A7Z0CL70_9MICO|nr:transglutaminase domain-containing protein [Demequina lutea]NYI42587.1 hypothetical protein [Demequina lutea]